MAVEEVASGALMDRDGTAGVLERARQTFARFRKGHPRGRRNRRWLDRRRKR